MEYMAKTFHYLLTFTRKEIFSASQNLLSEKKRLINVIPYFCWDNNFYMNSASSSLQISVCVNEYLTILSSFIVL